MKRPKLIKTDLRKFLADSLNGEKPGCFITMSPGQWDALLSTAYDRGWTLLELDDDERPVAAYSKDGDTAGENKTGKGRKAEKAVDHVEITREDQRGVSHL